MCQAKQLKPFDAKKAGKIFDDGARMASGICGQGVDGLCVAMYESNQRSNYYNRF